MTLALPGESQESEPTSNDALRARALRYLVSAVVLGAMRPLSRGEVLREVDVRLQGAWTDVTGLEVEAALDALDHGQIEIDLNGRFYAVEMSSGIDESLAHWVTAARAVEVLEETEGSDCETLRNRQFGELFKQLLLEPHAEKVLGTRASHERASRNELVERNLRLARAMAGRWDRSKAPALDGDDLFQEACLGLIRAAEKFDPHRGFKFSTYATWWLRQALARAVDIHSRTIRVPVHICDRLRIVGRARQKLLNSSPEREPSERELCKEAGISASQLEEVQRVRAMECVPIDEMRPDQELRAALMEVDSLEQEVFALMSRLKVDWAVSLLPPREAEVLRRRFGLDGHEPWTLDAIGLRLGVTRERVRQIEQSALEKIAEHLDLMPAPRTSA
jgi:RNA polymerase sigma factor (sigma-70 family)